MSKLNTYGKMRVLSLTVLLGAAACTSSTGGTNLSSTADSSAASTPAPAKSSSPSSEASTKATPQECRTEQIRASLSPGEGAAGSAYYQLTVVNTDPQDCLVNSIQITATDAQGSQMGEDFTKEEETTPLSLQADTQYSSTLRISQLAADDCKPSRAAGLKISINGHDIFVPSNEFQVCSGKVQNDKTMSTLKK